MVNNISHRGGESSLIKHLCLILLIVSIAALFVSCEDSDAAASPTKCTVNYYYVADSYDNKCLMKTESVEFGTIIDEPKIPLNIPDYTFAFWAVDEEDDNGVHSEIKFPYTITEDTTFYACTVKNSTVKTNGMLTYTSEVKNKADESEETYNSATVNGVQNGDNSYILVIPENCTVKQENSDQLLYCTVEKIGKEAFLQNTWNNKKYDNLTTVYLPNTIDEIGEKAFYDCSNLNYIHFNGTVDDWKKITLGDKWINREYKSITDGITIMCYDPTNGYKEAKATVTFKFNNEDKDKKAIKDEVVNVNYGAKVTQINSTDERFIKPGYEFQYWKLNNSKYTFDNTLVVDDIELEAYWGDEKAKITITLDANSGKFDTDETTTTNIENVLYNDLLSNYTDKLVEPTLDGYTFDGWYDAKVGGNEYELTDRITAGGNTKITFYAHWTENNTTDN